jgi:hypothetical protein
MENKRYNKDTYIGYLKHQNGGIKIIPGDKDNKIIERRDKILTHLNAVFSGGHKLKEKNLVKYFKALEGKYVRGKMTPDNTSGGSKETLKDAHKLIKYSLKKDFPLDTILNIFRGSSPKLYSKLESKVETNNYESRRSSYRSNGGYSESRESYRSEGGRRYSEGGGRYSGGEKLTLSLFRDIPTMTTGFSYHEYFLDKDNKDKRNAIIKEYEESNSVPSISDAIIYIGAIEALYNRNVLCDLGNTSDCNNKKGKALQMGRRLYKELKKTYPNNNIDGIFKDEGYNIFDYINKHKFGGYSESRESYRSEGGYNSENEKRRSFYRSEGDYGSESRRSSYRSIGGYSESRRSAEGDKVTDKCINDLDEYINYSNSTLEMNQPVSALIKEFVIFNKGQCHASNPEFRKKIKEKYNFDLDSLSHGGINKLVNYSMEGGQIDSNTLNYSLVLFRSLIGRNQNLREEILNF